MHHREFRSTDHHGGVSLSTTNPGSLTGEKEGGNYLPLQSFILLKNRLLVGELVTYGVVWGDIISGPPSPSPS